MTRTLGDFHPTSSPMFFSGTWELLFPLGRSCSITTWLVVSSFVFNFHQLFGGNDPFFTNIVSNGLKPPTGNCFRGFPNSWALHMTYVYCVHEGQALGVIITFVSSTPAQPKRFTQVIDKMFFRAYILVSMVLVIWNCLKETTLRFSGKHFEHDGIIMTYYWWFINPKANHLGYIKPCKQWDKLPTSTGAGFLNHQQ